MLADVPVTSEELHKAKMVLMLADSKNLCVHALGMVAEKAVVMWMLRSEAAAHHTLRRPHATHLDQRHLQTTIFMMHLFMKLGMAAPSLCCRYGRRHGAATQAVCSLTAG